MHYYIPKPIRHISYNEYYKTVKAVAECHYKSLLATLQESDLLFKNYKNKNILTRIGYFVKPEDGFVLEIPTSEISSDSNLYIEFYSKGNVLCPESNPIYANKSLREILEMPKTWVQGEYECLNPKKLISDVEGFNKAIRNTKTLRLYLEEIYRNHRTISQGSTVWTDNQKSTDSANWNLNRSIQEKYKSKPTYRSSWERTAFIFCDTEPNVIAWSSEQLPIPYISPVDNQVHRYFVDLIIWTKTADGNIAKTLVEIKPKAQTKPPTKTKRKKESTYIREMEVYMVNVAKWKYAKAYADQNGYNFIIWTEDQLNPSEQTVFGRQKDVFKKPKKVQ